jgi:two-component system, NarL family, nitrate/nitrite response regulator NarL
MQLFSGEFMDDISIHHAAAQSDQVIATVPGSDAGIRTVLVCANTLLRAGLTHLLANTSFVLAGSGLGEASSGERSTSPQLFIVDASSASDQTLDTLSSLKVQHPEAKVVAIAEHFDLSFVQSGREAGVDGFCLMTSGREVLITSLEVVMLGEVLLPTSVLRAVLEFQPASPQPKPQNTEAAPEAEFSDPKAPRLSEREAQILRYLMAGEPNKVIARILDVAEATVKVHIKAILRKVGVANRTQAAMWATGHLRASDSAAH